MKGPDCCLESGCLESERLESGCLEPLELRVVRPQALRHSDSRQSDLTMDPSIPGTRDQKAPRTSRSPELKPSQSVVPQYPWVHHVCTERCHERN